MKDRLPDLPRITHMLKPGIAAVLAVPVGEMLPGPGSIGNLRMTGACYYR